MKRKTKKNLKAALRGIGPRRLRENLAKDTAITIRLSMADRENMKRMAAAFNLTLTEYLTRLHLLAQERAGND